MVFRDILIYLNQLKSIVHRRLFIFSVIIYSWISTLFLLSSDTKQGFL